MLAALRAMPLGRLAWPAEGTDLRRFANWTLCWLVLPNLPFVFLWFVGGPPRPLSIYAFALCGLLFRSMPRAFLLPMFVILFAYMVATFIAGMFNLDPFYFLVALRFFAELDIAASPEYVLVAAGLAAVLVGAWFALALDQNFKSWQLALVAIVATLALARADVQLTYAGRGTYKHSAPGDAPHDSALSHLDLGATIKARRNLVIVMLESIGLPKNADVRARLLEPWQQAAVTARYELETGRTAYFGSTTSGEIRELCGRWGDFPELERGVNTDCLPARLAKAGYRTTAVHSFDGDFFDREDWYPWIGFQRVLFGPDLVRRGARVCPGVFLGACDADVPKLIASELSATKEPQLLYWLTVNSHLPVPAARELATDDCAAYDPGLARDHPMICRLMSIYDGVARALVPVLTDPDLPPTDVLLVGDHMPPFFDRRHRTQFDGEHVPWILLRHRDLASPSQPEREPQP